MTRSKMQKCLKCGTYGLSTTCKKCGGNAQAAGPLKFSPEDPQAKRRREYQKVTDPEWVKNLPTPKGEEDLPSPVWVKEMPGPEGEEE